jgi:hypothetical protein
MVIKALKQASSGDIFLDLAWLLGLQLLIVIDVPQ